MALSRPQPGIHGWFFVNKGKKDVTIHFTTSGFYDSARMYADGPPQELTIDDPK
jgi:hypothetical protein